MRKFHVVFFCSIIFGISTACGEIIPEDPKPEEISLSKQNLLRAMELADSAVSAHFTGSAMTMARYYNPYTETRSNEVGSIWMYTAAIEAVNAILYALEARNEIGESELYNEHFDRYSELLYKLYDNAAYYLGTFELVSYTQTKEWTVYGVNRGPSKGTAHVEGVMNVYDDQMWLIREFIEAYHLTDNDEYLEKAEYLAEYVLDGWDCTIDVNGEEYGGIPWGPGYVTKHSCSNGPMISPLVWLHEIYQSKDDEVEYRYIDSSDGVSRKNTMVKKSEYYLSYARKIYDWQKKYLLRSDGVYDDMMGGCTPGSPQTETINGAVYRMGTICRDRVGPAITYNSGTMLSGAVDLYRVTEENAYLIDAKYLADASFTYFADLGQTKPDYYTFDISGFRNWFNGVLMRAYVESYPVYANVSRYIDAYQDNLDYAYESFNYKGFLPTNLLLGWSYTTSNNKTEGMFNFAFAAEYALLSGFELEK